MLLFLFPHEAAKNDIHWLLLRSSDKCGVETLSSSTGLSGTPGVSGVGLKPPLHGAQKILEFELNAFLSTTPRY